MTDRYESVSVHGLMPLVVDRVTGALRFAVLEVDQPGDCVSSPADMPDALVQFFVFGSQDRAHAWAEGVREVASNAVTVEFPPVRFPKFAMLVRHDTEPLRGDTVDGCVALRFVGHRHDERHPRVGAAEDRKQEIDRARSERAESAYREEWAPEIAAIESTTNGCVAIDKRATAPGTPLPIQIRGSDGYLGIGPTFHVSRSGDGYSVSWKPSRGLGGSGDLAAGLETYAAKVGLELSDGGLSRTVAALDEPTLAAIRAADEAFAARSLAAGRTQRGRDLVAKHLADGKLVSLVERVVAGFPLVISANRSGCVQASPTAGRAIDVPDVRMRAAAEAGLIEGGWTVEHPIFGSTHVYVATDAARALLGPDPMAHADSILSAVRTDWWSFKGFQPKASLAEALPPVADPPARAVKALDAELDGALAVLEDRPVDRSAWAVIAAGVAHGLAEVGADGKPSRRR